MNFKQCTREISAVALSAMWVDGAATDYLLDRRHETATAEADGVPATSS